MIKIKLSWYIEIWSTIDKSIKATEHEMKCALKTDMNRHNQNNTHWPGSSHTGVLSNSTLPPSPPPSKKNKTQFVQWQETSSTWGYDDNKQYKHTGDVVLYSRSHWSKSTNCVMINITYCIDSLSSISIIAF